MTCLARYMTIASSGLVLSLLVGCATLTPQQSGGLKEAQRIADEVTTAYGLGRVRVFASDRLPAHSAAGYIYRHDWMLVSPTMLAKDELMVVVTHELGHVTLGHRSITYPSNLELFMLRRNELEANQRGVAIMVQFLGMTERDAASRYADYMVAANRARQGQAIGLPLSHFHPCVELRDLWRRLAYAESAPACEEN